MKPIVVIGAFAFLPVICAFSLFPYGFEAAWLVIFSACLSRPEIIEQHQSPAIAGLLLGASVILLFCISILPLDRQDAISAVVRLSLVAQITDMSRFLTSRSNNTAVYWNTIFCLGAVAALPAFFWDYSRSTNREAYPVRKNANNRAGYWVGFGALSFYLLMLKHNHMVYPFYRQLTLDSASGTSKRFAPILNAGFDSWSVVCLVAGATFCAILLSGWIQLIKHYLTAKTR